VPLLLDTGVIYALADRDDAWHERCVEHVATSRELLLVPVTVVPEAAYLIRSRLNERAEQQLISAIAARELATETLGEVDWRRSAELMLSYPEIGFVDASVVAIAERLRLKAIATTDRRHFARIRPRHIRAFELVP
jgi:uncharacterized protein